MTNLYRSHRSSGGGSRFWRVASVVVLAALGVAVVLGAIAWFRAQESTQQSASDTRGLAEGEQTRAPDTRTDATAALLDASGTSIGLVTRSGTIEATAFQTVVHLPAIDGAASAYALWLLQDGLADVVSVGDLVPRADGSWELTFTAADPLDYPRIVITLEPNDGNPLPSGNQVATGSF